jgi:MFS family permease
VRRLLLLASCVVLVDTMLYAALTPLLPRFARELSLSKSQAGLLVASYALGALVGGLPGGVAAVKLGPRRAMVAGLAAMSAAGLGFAFASGFGELCLTRFVQGAGSALTWAGAFAWLVSVAPRERRGEVIGTALGAAVFGALLGPVVGAVAAIAGVRPTFTGVSALGVVLMAWTLRTRVAPPAEVLSWPSVARAFSNRIFLGGTLLLLLASFLFGIVGVLAPLHLAAAGWGATAIGALWLVGAAFEAGQSPLIGRFTDRRGRAPLVRAALLAAVPLAVGLALVGRPLVYAPLLVGSAMAYGALFTPSMAMIADGAERVLLAQGLAFGLMNAAWAVGNSLGPVLGGALAQVTGDRLPYLVSAGLALGTYALVRRSAHERAVVVVDPLAGDAAGVGRE